MNETKSQSTSRKQKLVKSLRANRREDFRALLTDDYAERARHVLGPLMEEAIQEEAGWAAAQLLERGVKDPEKYATMAVKTPSPGVVLAMTEFDVPLDIPLKIALKERQINCAESIFQQKTTTFDHKHKSRRNIGKIFFEYDPLQIREFLANGGFAENAFYDDRTREPGSIASEILRAGMVRGTTEQLRALLYDYAGEPRSEYVRLCRQTARWAGTRWWAEPRKSSKNNEERGKLLQEFLDTVLDSPFGLSDNVQQIYRNGRLLAFLQQKPGRKKVSQEIGDGEANPFGTVTTRQAERDFAPATYVVATSGEGRGAELFSVLAENVDDEVIREGSMVNMPNLYRLCVRQEQYDLLLNLLQYEPLELNTGDLVEALMKKGEVAVAVELLSSSKVEDKVVDSALPGYEELFDEQSEELCELVSFLSPEQTKELLFEAARKNKETFLRSVLKKEGLKREHKQEAAYRAWLNRQKESTRVLVDNLGRGSVLRYFSDPDCHESALRNAKAVGRFLYVLETFIDTFAAPESEHGQAFFKNLVLIGLNDQGNNGEDQVVQTLRYLKNSTDATPDDFDSLYGLIISETSGGMSLFRTLARWHPPSPSFIDTHELSEEYCQILREELDGRQQARLQAEGIKLS